MDIGLQKRLMLDKSSLLQCTKCLGFGHTKVVCRENDELCSHCGKAHSWDNCKARKEGLPLKCKNCLTLHGDNPTFSQAHNAFSGERKCKMGWHSAVPYILLLLRAQVCIYPSKSASRRSCNCQISRSCH